jgi:two-component system sensor histidine kinase YcbA
LKHIFSPGFSTKINYTTGQINRGLGLSVVLDIVERELKGRVNVNSTKDIGTTFLIYIPRDSLEVI